MADLTNPDYDNLPGGIKAMMTVTEYFWLGDEGRAKLIERETMPDEDVTE